MRGIQEGRREESKEIEEGDRQADKDKLGG